MRALSLMALLFAASASASAAPTDCLQKCEQAKKKCFAQYTQSDSRSGKYVTPEGHKICWGNYHDCKKTCPAPAKK